MDLAIGARVFVMMDHLTRDGECKLVAQQLPADRRRLRQPDLYRLAVIDITDRGPVVREIFNSHFYFEELQRITWWR